MQLKHAINWHKGLTTIFVLGLMVAYQNFTLGAWVYLALHGTYGILWLVKDRLYPDKQWEQETTFGMGVVTFIILGLYWVAPFLLIRSGVVPPLPLVAGAIACNIVGVFLHYTSDAQKYYTLKYNPGLITEGFFANCRNTNYLGEILIYSSFALLACHWVPWLILSAFVGVIFVPNMRKKDQSLARYSEFASYRARSGLVFPKLFSLGASSTSTQSEAQSSSEL
jgi:protein-S-isoprenylcysteine O-methyltransferase Ste14